MVYSEERQRFVYEMIGFASTQLKAEQRMLDRQNSIRRVSWSILLKKINEIA